MTHRSGSFTVIPGVRQAPFSFGSDDIGTLLNECRPSVVVNAIGVTRQVIRLNGVSEDSAWSTNSSLPRELARLLEERGTRFLHLSTDCVFDGSRGLYREEDELRPTDLYAATKAAGEAVNPDATVIRTSFIGPHGSKTGLLAWFASQPRHAVIEGYTDHTWNGVTTVALAELVRAWVVTEASFQAIQHIYSWPPLTKFELLNHLRRRLGRTDITINPRATGKPQDLTLLSSHLSSLEAAWASIGYSKIPDIQTLIEHM
jgi:dTDP-4-dehydrorhamnose reductase